MNATNEMLSITGGQGAYPLAYIPTTRTLEFTFASAEFTLDMFAMSNDVPVKSADTSTFESRIFNVVAGNKITLPFQTKTGTVRIKGFALAEGETPETGKFTVVHGESEAATTTVTFDPTDAPVGTKMRVAYRRRVNGASVATVQTNGRTAKGSLFAHWPVYSSGTDTADSAIKGYLHLEIPRVRVTALPGFDNSYKSAATNSVTFAAVDPREADAQMYKLTYEPLDSQGNVVTVPAAGADEW